MLSTPPPAFKPTHRLTVMRKKVLHGTEQIRTKAAVLLLGMGYGPTRQHVREEIVRQVARGIRIPQLVAEECGHWFVAGATQFGQGASALQ